MMECHQSKASKSINIKNQYHFIELAFKKRNLKNNHNFSYTHRYALCLCICLDTFFSYSASSSKETEYLFSIFVNQPAGAKSNIPISKISMHCFQEKKTNINYFDFQIKEELTDKEITKITVWILLRCFPFTHFSLTMWSTLKGGRHFCFENPAKSLGPISNRSRPFESVTK